MQPSTEKIQLLVTGQIDTNQHSRNASPDSTENSTLTALRKGYSAIGQAESVGAGASGAGQAVPRDITPVTLAWKGVTVAKTRSPRRCRWFRRGEELEDRAKIILKDVTGFAEPGTLTAIMGSSGAGKSTLLKALADRSEDDLVVAGQILANGSEVVSSLASITAFVEQDDLFMEWLKVKEHLLFQAAVRMDTSVSAEARHQRVDDVIRSVGLVECSDTVIGNALHGASGLSGGERKRLALASELFTNPSLMFCDEPTTGLDSFLARSVVSTLKSLAAEGRTVLCTIHQPPSSTFALFDKLIFVTEGAIAFQGSCKEAVAFFGSVGYACPDNHNPADFFVRTLAIKPTDEDVCRQRVQNITQAFLKSSYFEGILAKCLLETEDSKNDGNRDGPNRLAFKASWWRQFVACVRRAHLNNKREPLMSKIRLVQTIALGLVLGLVFLRERIDQDGVQNITGALFLLVSNSAFANTFTTVQVIPTEIALVKREHRASLYRLDAWFLAKFVTEIPFHMILLPVILVTIPYWMIGLYPAATNYFTACLVICLSTSTAISFAYFLSSVSRTVSMALAIAPPIVFGLMLLGGLFINVRDIPPGLAWISYLSWFRFGFEALLINEWADVEVIECPLNKSATCVESGQILLEAFSFQKSNLMTSMCGMLALLVGFRVASFLVLLRRCRRRK